MGPPQILTAAGHPLRWRLLGELAHGDLAVRQLMSRLDQPQSLVSYHLGVLRKADLVRARRSSADGRDIYYRLELTRCGDALAEAGAALHPALGTGGAARKPGKPRVLFLCTGNSGRSPMAAALLRHRTGAEAASAGSHPKPLNPHAVRALAEYGITLTHEPTHLDSVRQRRFEWVISLCDRVREVAPEFPGRPRVVHWSIPDPARDADGFPAFRRVAAELDTRIGFLAAEAVR